MSYINIIFLLLLQKKEKKKISLEHLVVLGSKDALKSTKGWRHVKLTQDPTWKSFQQPKLEQTEQPNK